VFKIIFPHYCLGQGLLDMSMLYNTAEVKRNFGYSSEYNPLEFELVGQNLVFMVVQGFFYFSLNLLIQYRFFIYHRSKIEENINDYNFKPDDSKIEDTTENIDDYYVRLKNLSKIYKKFFSSKQEHFRQI